MLGPLRLSEDQLAPVRETLARYVPPGRAISTAELTTMAEELIRAVVVIRRIAARQRRRGLKV